MHTQSIRPQDSKEFVDRFDNFIFDCDGVVWLGNKLIPGVDRVLNSLIKSKRVLFVSNNSTKAREEYVEKFKKMGISVDVSQVFGSSYAAAIYIKKVLKLEDKKVFVVGMKGIQQELENQGIEWVGGEEFKTQLSDLGKLDTIKPIPGVGAVLFGMDLNISYHKYAQAFTILHNDPHCHFLATNDDLTFPAGGTGALLAALAAPLKREPQILGKPHQTMLDAILAECHLDPSRTCMVGDRLDTDIQFGINGGLKTLLVGTGVTSESERIHSPIKADYFIESLGDLVLD